MRTSIDIPDPLLRQARALARRRKTTLREVFLDGLRLAIASTRPAATPYAMPDASFGAGGVHDGIDLTDWERVRELAYGGRGG